MRQGTGPGEVLSWRRRSQAAVAAAGGAAARLAGPGMARRPGLVRWKPFFDSFGLRVAESQRSLPGLTRAHGPGGPGAGLARPGGATVTVTMTRRRTVVL
jgi:hypothetical protein